MNTKILTAIITSTLIMTSFNAYSAPNPSAKPSSSPSNTDKMRMDQHKMHMKNMNSKMKDMHNTEQWKKIMTDTLNNAQSLVDMGSKVVKDGNFANNPEKMIMGAKMMISGMNILNTHKEHQMMMKDINKQAKPMNMTTEKHNTLMKSINESSELIMLMANKLIKEGNSSNDPQKMMSGSELLKTGMDLHHGMMSGHGKKEMMHHKMKKTK